MKENDILELRKSLGETQCTFGERVGVSSAMVSFWEAGRSQPSAKHMNTLSSLKDEHDKISFPKLPFRPIQYLGSKMRLCSAIAEAVNSVSSEQSRVGDLFAGSGVVGHYLAAHRPVSVVDIQQYSRVLNKALLQNSPQEFDFLLNDDYWLEVDNVVQQIESLIQPLLKFEADSLIAAAQGDASSLVEVVELGSIGCVDQFPSRTGTGRISSAISSSLSAIRQSSLTFSDLTATIFFAGAYFSYKQAAVMDAMDIACRRVAKKSYSSLQAVMLSVASDVVNTVGKQFAQPIKLEKKDGSITPILLQRTLRDRSMVVQDVAKEWIRRWSSQASGRFGGNKVFDENVIDFLSSDSECAVYYADPPYTIDHYSRFYHVLETLVLRDNPALASRLREKGLEPMRGLYRNDRTQSSFSISSKVGPAFDQLFRIPAEKGVPLILSYSPFDEGNARPRLLTMDDIIRRAKVHYKRVDTVVINEHSHKKLNSKFVNSGTRIDAERLLICEA